MSFEFMEELTRPLENELKKSGWGPAASHLGMLYKNENYSCRFWRGGDTLLLRVNQGKIRMILYKEDQGDEISCCFDLSDPKCIEKAIESIENDFR